MQPITYFSQITGRSVAELLGLPAPGMSVAPAGPLVAWHREDHVADEHGVVSDIGRVVLDHWDASLGAQPTTDAIVAAEAEPEPPPVPPSVKDYQFAGQAAAEGIIAADERTGWIKQGEVPSKLLFAVGALPIPDDQKERVIEFLEGATEFPRYHPNTITLGAVFGKDTPEKLDAFFVAAGQR